MNTCREIISFQEKYTVNKNDPKTFWFGESYIQKMVNDGI